MMVSLGFQILVYSKTCPSKLDRCCESVIEQTITPDEVVIFLDGEVPLDIRKLVWRFALRCKRKKITFRVGSNRFNLGRGAARAHAVELASTDYILILDSDDYCDENRVAITKSAITSAGQVFCVSGDIRDEHNKKRKLLTRKGFRSFTFWIYQSVNHGASAINTRQLIEIGSYDCNYRFAEDYVMFAKAKIRRYEFAYVPRILTYVSTDDVGFWGRRVGVDRFRVDLKLARFVLSQSRVGFFMFVFASVARLSVAFFRSRVNP